MRSELLVKSHESSDDSKKICYNIANRNYRICVKVIPMPELNLQIKAEQTPDLSQTNLLMIAGENHFSYALLNRLTNELFEFGYHYSEKFNEEGWTNFFDEHAKLSERYFQSAIAFCSPEALLVPSSLYKAEEAQLQHTVIYGQKVQSALITEFIAEWNLYNIYRVPESLRTAASRKFITGKFWNIYSVLLKNSAHENQSRFLVNFRTDEFSVIVFRNGSLQLTQTFPYTSPEDVLYSLLKICNQFDISQQEVMISLSGLIEKDSSIYRELYKYFIQLDFETIPDSISVSQALSEYPLHYYSSICKLAKCVS